MAPPSDPAAPTRDPPGTSGPSLSLIFTSSSRRDATARGLALCTHCVFALNLTPNPAGGSLQTHCLLLSHPAGTSAALLAFSSWNTDAFTPWNPVLFHQPLCPHSIPGHVAPYLTAAPRRCLLHSPPFHQRLCFKVWHCLCPFTHLSVLSLQLESQLPGRRRDRSLSQGLRNQRNL